MHDHPPQIPLLAPLIDALPDATALVEVEAGAGLGFTVLHANGAFRANSPGPRPDLRALVARVAETGEAEILEPADASVAFSASRPWPGRVLLVLRSPARTLGLALTQAEAEVALHGAINRNAAEALTIVGADDGIIRYTNRAFDALFGYAEGELIGRPVSIINTPTERSAEETATAIIEACRSQGTWQGEIMNRHKDGTAFWTSASASAYTHPELGCLIISHQSDVTARKHAEAARTASEHRMRTIAELCPVPLAENDRDGNILFLNAAFLRTYGYTQAQIPTLKEWWAAAYPDPAYREHVRQAWLERMDAAQATGTPFETMEVTIRCADGADRVALADFVPYGKTADEPFLVSLFDITEIVAARRTQETARRHAEHIIDSVGEGLCLYDRDGCIQYINPVGANLLGYEPHRIIGRSVHALFHHSRPDGSPLPAEACVIQNTVRLGQTQFSGAEVFWRRDGSSFPVQFVAAPLLEEGETEAAVLTFRDITEETRVLKTLLDNEIKIRKAQEIAGFGSYATDLLTGRWESSAVLDAIFGVPPDFDHTIPNWNSVLDPEFQQPALDHYLEVAAGKCDFRMDYRIIRPIDGVKRWVAANGELEFDANGTPTRLIGTIQDITDRKEKEQALAALVHEKEALLKEVHHRVKNNLQVITSLLRLEIARTSQPDTKAVLSDMQGRIRSMAILHQSLYRSGDFGAIDLGDYLRQLATQTHLAQSTRASAMRLRCEVASMFVNIDQAIPCGLLVNELVSNCVKHAFPEGFEGANAITLSLQPAPDPGQWRLEVADTGVGLPPDFDARRAASLGLQLATDLARQLGGTLVVGPTPGGGARFTVDFAPMERPSRAAP